MSPSPTVFRTRASRGDSPCGRVGERSAGYGPGRGPFCLVSDVGIPACGSPVQNLCTRSMLSARREGGVERCRHTIYFFPARVIEVPEAHTVAHAALPRGAPFRWCSEPARRLVIGIVFGHHRAARRRDTRRAAPYRTASSVVARAGRRGRFDGFCSCCCKILR